jgi:hypothetical protein
MFGFMEISEEKGKVVFPGDISPTAGYNPSNEVRKTTVGLLGVKDILAVPSKYYIAEPEAFF